VNRFHGEIPPLAALGRNDDQRTATGDKPPRYEGGTMAEVAIDQPRLPQRQFRVLA